MSKDKRQVMQNRAKKIARDKSKADKRKKAASAGGNDFTARFGVSRAAIREAPIQRVLVSRSIL
ncbi:MAG: hypothetical protein WCK89_21490, partial [bacterium]